MNVIPCPPSFPAGEWIVLVLQVMYSRSGPGLEGLSIVNLFVATFMAMFFWLALGGFFLYHFYLVSQNKTTIESMEKGWREKQRVVAGKVWCKLFLSVS